MVQIHPPFQPHRFPTNQPPKEFFGRIQNHQKKNSSTQKIFFGRIQDHEPQILDIFCCKSLLHGVATISRPLEIKGLFCKRALEKRLYSVKETYNLKEPTNRSRPLGLSV